MATVTTVGISTAMATSAERASTFTRSLFADDYWTATEVSSFVNTQRNATIASVSPAGQPHTAVVVAASVDDEIYFTVNPASVLARNLHTNDRIGLSVFDTRHAIMSQGHALCVGPALELTELIERLAATSPSGHFTPDGWDGDIYRINLTRLVAN